MGDSSRSRRALPYALGAALATGAMPAVSGFASPAGVLEEIVVTASRSEQRVFDSPATLSVLTQEQLDRAIASTTAEILRDVAGVQVSDSGQPGLSRIRIRGEESRRTAVLINSQEVTDHYEMGTPFTLHPAMIERVEVVRGSGSVLYGSRALSGVVNFLTRKGGTRPLQATLSGGYDSATGGYDNFASLYGNAAGQEYRLAWSESEHGDRETPAGTIDNTAFDNESLYLYTGRAFGDHRVEYTWEDYESASDVFVEEAVRTAPPLVDFYLETPQRDREKHGLFYSWDADLRWLRRLAANAFLQDSRRHFYTYSELRSAEIGYDRDIDSISDLDGEGALLQGDFQPLAGHSLIAGLQYQHDDVDQTRYVDTVYVTPPQPPGAEAIRDEASIDTWAWFAQDQWDISDRLTLTGGLRQYFVDGRLQYSDRESLSPGSLDQDDELIGALGLVFAASDALRLRANVAQGYVYPSLTQLATGAYAGSSFVNPDPDLDPETSVDYEVGLRLQRARLVVDATAFYTRSDDYIHHLPCASENNCPGSRDRYYTNIGESRAHGVELYLGWGWPAGGLEPYTSLIWMERRNDYSEFSTWDTGVPALAGRAGLRWQGALWRLPAWADVYLRGETDSEVEEPGTVRAVLDEKDGWLTVNLTGGIDFGGEQQYRLALDLLNLADKRYTASGENVYGAGRSAAIKLTLDW